MGNDYSVAWRTLDAQFWGVPQRRKRIFFVADFRGQRAGKILFEQESLSRYFTPGKKEGQSVTKVAETDIRASGFSGNNSVTAGGVSLLEEKSPTLQVKKSSHVMIVENHPEDSRVNLDNDGIVQTLTSRMGTGGGNVPMVMQSIGVDAYNQTTSGDTAVTLTSRSGCSATHSGPMVMCVSGNTIDREPHNGGNGSGCQEDISYTLNTIDRHAVAYEQQVYDKYVESSVGSTIKACGGTYHGGSETLIVNFPTIRRLTPLECCRLQGFPDWWCNDIPHADSAEYKMWGNGVALPCVLYVMEGVADELKKEGLTCT